MYESVGDGWVQARLAEIPAVITAAPSQREAREALTDALREYILALTDANPEEHLGMSEPVDVTIGD